MTTAVDVMTDLLDAQVRSIHGDLEDATEEMIHWHAHENANTIAVTIWHFSRIADMVANVILSDKEPSQQFWFTDGYAEKYDYNPLGKGIREWGILTGFTPEEMHEIPEISKEDTLAYFDKAFESVKTHIEGMNDEAFDAPISGAGGDRSAYYWTRLIVVDATRHMGEIQALKTMWQHTFAPDTE